MLAFKTPWLASKIWSNLGGKLSYREAPKPVRNGRNFFDKATAGDENMCTETAILRRRNRRPTFKSTPNAPKCGS